MRNHFEAHESLPSDDDLVYEGCSIIFGSEFFSPDLATTACSWLRDLFMSSTEIAEKARLRPMNQLAKMRMSQLQIKGKSDIFEECELESQLCRYLGAHINLGLALSNSDLQQEACAILNRIESSSTNPSRRFAGFLVRLIWQSTEWLAPLRQRGEHFSQHLAEESRLGLVQNPAGLLSMDDNMDIFYGGLADLGQLTGEAGSLLGTTATCMQVNSEPHSPKLFAPVAHLRPGGSQMPLDFTSSDESTAPQDLYMRLQTAKTLFAGSGHSLRWSERPGGAGMPFFLNDPNRYRRLARELSRFVATSMSPNNPNMHKPTDDELRYHARWIFFDEYVPLQQL